MLLYNTDQTDWCRICCFVTWIKQIVHKYINTFQDSRAAFPRWLEVLVCNMKQAYCMRMPEQLPAFRNEETDPAYWKHWLFSK